MATLSQANKAREDHGEALQKMGAHSIGVDKVDVGGSQTFAVIAYVQKKTSKIPDSLEIDWKNGKKKVPLITKIAGGFKAE